MSKTIEISDFNVMCRTCLSYTSNLTPICSLGMSETLRKCLGFQMNQDTRLPNAMCNMCIDFVNTSVKFKSQCQNSENILLLVLQNSIELESDRSKILNSISEDVICNDYMQPSDSDTETQTILTNREVSNTNLICDICGFISQQLNKLARHRSVKHNIEDFVKCDQCNRIFPTIEQLSIHLKCHSKQCNQCDKVFESAFKLKRHQVVHVHKTKTHYCRFCSKSFTRTDTLQEHIKRKHSERPRSKQVCNICGKSVYNLNHHMKQKHISRTELPFPCDICDKAFAFRSMLQKHKESVHENKQLNFDHLCNICGKKFKTKGELKSHMDTHCIERRHQCSKCDKKYKTHSALWRHTRVHLGMKPFVCSHCDKRFVTKVILVNHIRTHTGEKPFKCNICSRAFSVSATLNTHKKLIHGK